MSNLGTRVLPALIWLGAFTLSLGFIASFEVNASANPQIGETASNVEIGSPVSKGTGLATKAFFSFLGPVLATKWAPAKRKSVGLAILGVLKE